MTTNSIAFELPFESLVERRAAVLLRKRFSSIKTEDIRNHRNEVNEMITQAGLYAGCGGSHIFICRVKDKEQEEKKIKSVNPLEGYEVLYRNLYYIPRWAIICETKMANSWQQTAVDRRSNTLA